MGRSVSPRPELSQCALRVGGTLPHELSPEQGQARGCGGHKVAIDPDTRPSGPEYVPFEWLCLTLEVTLCPLRVSVSRGWSFPFLALCTILRSSHLEEAQVSAWTVPSSPQLLYHPGHGRAHPKWQLLGQPRPPNNCLTSPGSGVTREQAHLPGVADKLHFPRPRASQRTADPLGAQVSWDRPSLGLTKQPWGASKPDSDSGPSQHEHSPRAAGVTAATSVLSPPAACAWSLGPHLSLHHDVSLLGEYWGAGLFRFFALSLEPTLFPNNNHFKE